MLEGRYQSWKNLFKAVNFHARTSRFLLMSTSQPCKYYAHTLFPNVMMPQLLIFHVSNYLGKSLVCDTQEKCSVHDKIFYWNSYWRQLIFLYKTLYCHYYQHKCEGLSARALVKQLLKHFALNTSLIEKTIICVICTYCIGFLKQVFDSRYILQLKSLMELLNV